MKEIFLAHSPTEDSPGGQPLGEHLKNVSNLSSYFCEAFGASQDGRACGLYHDIGKYSDAFQRRLRGSTEKVDHSSAGALLLFENRNIPAAICVAGHHSGLTDIGTRNDLDGSFMARINRARAGEIENCDAWKSELPAVSKIESKSVYWYIAPPAKISFADKNYTGEGVIPVGVFHTLTYTVHFRNDGKNPADVV